MIEYMTYKGYVIEWKPMRYAYCVYEPDKPDVAVCWGDTLLEATQEVDYIIRQEMRRYRKAGRK